MENKQAKTYNEFFVWNKGQKLELSKNFKTNEFDCQCSNASCVEQRIAIDLINRLQALREASEGSITVTSGYRCEAHQAALKAKSDAGDPNLPLVAKNSTHTKGIAADIKIAGHRSGESMEPIVSKFFTSIGTAARFLHVDTREGIRRFKY